MLEDRILLWLQIIGILGILCMSLLEYVVNHKWRDKRTKEYRKSSKILLILILLFGAISVASVCIDYQNNSKNLQDVERREIKAISQRDEIRSKLLKIESQLAPFIKLATKKYQQVAPEKALENLANEIRDLRLKTLQLEQKTTNLETRESFRSLNKEKHDHILNLLTNFRTRYGNKSFTIHISAMNDRQCIILANELKDLLKEAGFNTVGPQNLFGWINTPVSLERSESDSEYSQEFIAALQPLFIERIKEITGSGLSGQFYIYINDKPYFNSDGVVTFQK